MTYSSQVTIENVRVNDFYRSEDEGKIGAPVAGNYNCSKGDGTKPFAQGYCCFCKPNGVRASQVAVWVRRSIPSAETRAAFSEAFRQCLGAVSALPSWPGPPVLPSETCSCRL